jgi:hypothetical protein
MRGACGGIRGVGWRWRACACAGRVGSGCARLWRGFAECVLSQNVFSYYYTCVLTIYVSSGARAAGVLAYGAGSREHELELDAIQLHDGILALDGEGSYRG